MKTQPASYGARRFRANARPTVGQDALPPMLEALEPRLLLSAVIVLTPQPAAASLAGYNYVDANNDGVKQAGEAGIAGTTITLTGTDSFGPVSLTATTADDGSYGFMNLRPGTYTITETQPDGYLDGKDTQGTPGTGMASDDVISNITLASGIDGVNNNFGELKPASISGYVYDDSPDNNGLLDGTEPGIAGVKITLTGNDDLGPVSLTTTTADDGSYGFTNLRPGTYTITETQPDGYLDGKDTAGTLGGVVAVPSILDQINAIAVASGSNGNNYNFGELEPAGLSGFVYIDVNNNGQIDLGEQGIAGATVKLTGTDDLGRPVSLTAQTNADGAYAFNTLRQGTYLITEEQPANYLDGKDTVGSLGGTVGNDVFSQISLPAGADGLNYNFGELLQQGTPIGSGQTATIGFWHNKNGQALIKSLNGGPSATNLANWLADNFRNLYGVEAGASNLTGKTNAQVAEVFLKLFSAKGQKLDAQVLAVALAAYVTNSSLAGSAAVKYGFTVTAGGTGASTYNVRLNGAAFGVANNSTLTVLDILKKANSIAVRGVLYNGNNSLRNMANTVFDGINTAGDIG